MPPVRITLDGYDPQLPLRGISVGGTEQVGVVLMVLAAARVDAMNFPNARLDQAVFEVGGLRPDAFYGAAQQDLQSRFGRDVWVTESALSYSGTDLRQALLAPEDADAATDIDASSHAPSAQELDLALNDIGPNVVVTRLHSSVPTLELVRDLVLEPATDGSVVSRNYAYSSPRCGRDAGQDAFQTRSRCVCTTPGAVPRSPLRHGLIVLAVAITAASFRRRSRTN
jgi:hypothetical protein